MLQEHTAESAESADSAERGSGKVSLKEVTSRLVAE